MNDKSFDNCLSIPLSENLIQELFDRQPTAGIRTFIEDIVWDYLERTSEASNGAEREKQGIKWGRLYLPGGTRLMMEYKGKQKFATVSNNVIIYEDIEFESPSRLANHIANGTSRNAWRDFWIKRPTDKEWMQAELLRFRNEREKMIDLDQLFRK